MEEYIYFLKSRVRDAKSGITDKIVVAAKSEAYLKEYAELFNREAAEFGLNKEYFVDKLRIDQAMVDTYLGAYRDRYLSKAYYDRYNEKKDMYYDAFIKASNNKYSEFCEKLCQNPDMTHEPDIDQEAIDGLANQSADDEIFHTYKMGEYQIFLSELEDKIVMDVWKLNAFPMNEPGKQDKRIEVKRFNTYFHAYEYILNTYFKVVSLESNYASQYQIDNYFIFIIKSNIGVVMTVSKDDKTAKTDVFKHIGDAYAKIFKIFAVD